MANLKKAKERPFGRNFGAYQKLTPTIWHQCKMLGKDLAGKKILHVNSTEEGGGVAEMLKSQIGLERFMGVRSEWYVMAAPVEFFEITKKIHNFLQGEEGKLSFREKKTYSDWVNFNISPDFKKILKKERPDIVIIHDPQPMPLVKHLPSFIPGILRLHIDLSVPNFSSLDFLGPLANKFKKVVVSSSKYVCLGDPARNEIIMPAIDPLSEKNAPLPLDRAKNILKNSGLDVGRPIISQVARFDKWKDPLGAIEMYKEAKRIFPKLQLILAGFLRAKDDPEANWLLEAVKKAGQNDSDVHIFHDPRQLRGSSEPLFINAVYTLSHVLIQKSLREGFGMTVTEAMWKGKPVIGGKTAGIGLQIINEENGFLVSGVNEAAEILIRLLKDQKLSKRIGRSAKQSVKRNFLISRLLLEHLRLYQNALENNDYSDPIFNGRKIEPRLMQEGFEM